MVVLLFYRRGSLDCDVMVVSLCREGDVAEGRVVWVFSFDFDFDFFVEVIPVWLDPDVDDMTSWLFVECSVCWRLYLLFLIFCLDRLVVVASLSLDSLLLLDCLFLLIFLII